VNNSFWLLVSRGRRFLARGQQLILPTGKKGSQSCKPVFIKEKQTWHVTPMQYAACAVATA
jgi:hypothetical protein